MHRTARNHRQFTQPTTRPHPGATIPLQQHAPRVLDVLLDLDEELDRFPAIEQTVVVGESKVHHGPDLDLAIDGNRPVLDGVEAKDGGLREVDNGSTVERTEDTAVADGEGAASHVLDGELSIARLSRKAIG